MFEVCWVQPLDVHLLPPWYDVDDVEGLRRLHGELASARAGQEASVEGLQAGADDYLVKPFAATELLARVRANIELARLRSHHIRWRTALVDSLQEAFFVCDERGAVIEINSSFTDIGTRSAAASCSAVSRARRIGDVTTAATSGNSRAAVGHRVCRIGSQAAADLGWRGCGCSACRLA